MTNIAKTLSQHNSRIFTELQSTVLAYPIDIPTIEKLLLQIVADAESDPAYIATKTQTLFSSLLMTILNVEVDKDELEWQKKCGLPQQRLGVLKKTLEAVCGGPASQKLKRTVVISFIQNVLECLGVSDLTEILDLISTQIPRFASALQENDQLKLLRIINFLLKRVSKTQDYHLRGQLHLALTKFLPFCHDSGFHFKAIPAKASQWEKIDQEQPIEALAPGLTYEFYQQFWELQKWFMEPAQVIGEGMNARLKKIQKTLQQLSSYFSVNRPKGNSDYYSQPLKFLKNYNLLALQLGDPFFRKVIMVQIIFFVHAIHHPHVKGSVVFTESDKKILAEIDAIPKKFFSEKVEEGKFLLQQFQTVLNGEFHWISMKQNWKDKKKSFYKKTEETEEENKRKEELKPVIKELQRRKAEIKKLANDKLKIDGSNLQKFLQNRELINLESGPTYPSFSYFFSQARSCLMSFDRENGKQNQFETRAEYNMFEWKAMRSLYRQNIKEIWSSNDKAPIKMREYRLVTLINRKQEDFTDPQPSKKVKQN